jgi:TP901 family phage tail tape measure protein
MSNVGGSAVTPLSVRIVISTSGAQQAATAMRSATSAVNNMGGQFARAQVPIRSMGDSMRQVSSLINYTMIMPLYKLGTAAIQASRNFEMSMKKIQGLVGVSAGEVNNFSNAILKMGTQVGKGPQELGDAMYFIASAGLRGAEALGVLNQAARSAAAGLGETKIIADALTSVINAYGQNVYSASRANDILVATVREGKTEADQFAPALGKVLPIAAAYGASFENVSAGMAALTRTGTTAGTSAIYLRQVMSQLLKPAKAAREALDAAGTSADEIRQNVKDKGLLNALSELNTKLGGTDTSLAVDGLTKVFGNVRALQAVLSLLGPNLEENRKIFAEVANSTGDAARAFDIYRQSADYAFKQAVASGQTALIGLGNALMPLATGLAHLGTVLGSMATGFLRLLNSTSGLIGFFSGIGRAVLLFAAGALLTAKVANGLFRTMASGVRMAAHLGNVFNGLTNGVRKAGMASARSSQQFAGLTMTEEQELAATTEINAAIAKNELTRSKLAGILAKNNASLTESATLTTVEKISTDEAKISQQGLALAIEETQMASESFAVTMMTILPQVFAIGIALTTVASLFGIGPFGGKTKDTEKTVQSLTDLNTELGITAGYAKSGLSLRVDAISTDGKTPAETRKTFLDNIEKSLTGSKKLIENALSSGVAREKVDAGLAIMSQLTFDSDASKAKFVTQLASMLQISSTDLISSTGGISDVISGQILAAVGQIKGDIVVTPTINADTATYGSIGEQEAQSYLDGFSKNISADNNSGQREKFFKNLGKQSSEAFGRSGDFGAIVMQLGKVGTALKQTDTITQEAYGNEQFLATAFKGLKDSTLGIDFKDIGGGLNAIIANKDNLGSFSAVFQQMGLSTSDTKVLLKELNDKFAENPYAPAAVQMQMFSETVMKNAVVIKNHNDAMRDSANAAYDASTEFANGLNPAIQEQVDAYDAATAAIKRYQDGQKALAGLSQDFITAQIDANDAAGKLGDSLAKSGGKVGTSGLAGAAYNDLIKFKDAALNVANIMAADPLKGPGQSANYLAQQYTNAINALTKGGTDLGTAQKQLADIGFTLTDVGDKSSVLKTFTGNKEGVLAAIGKGTAAATPGVSKDIVAGLTEGLKLSQTDLSVISAFNAKLVAQFKDDWGIKSPSKKAEAEIGGPIFAGIMKGITDPSNVLDLKARMADLGSTAGAGFRAGMMNGLAGTAVGFAADAARYAGQAAVYLSRGGATANKRVVENFGQKVVARVPGGGTGNGGISPIVPTPASILAGSSGSGGGGSKKVESPAEKALQKVMDKMANFSTVFIEFIDKAVKDSKSALGYISSYIDAQMKVASSMIDRQKLVIEQLAYETKLRKAEREAAYNAQKFGANAGADVTAYEMSRIQDLQLAYETASRNYAMRRGSLTAMVDAEQALLEARAAAAEVSPDVISGQTSLLDAQLKLKNKDLELAAATVNVTEAAMDQTEAAINLKIHMADASKIFASFAKQTIPDVAKSIDDLGLALSDPNGTFQYALHGLGMDVFNKLAEAAREAGLISSVPKYVTGNPLPTPGGIPTGASSTTPGATFTPVGQPGVTSTYGTPSPELLALWRSNPSAVRPEEIERFQLWNYMAMGGIVANGPVKAIVGEAGPEAIIPLNSINTRLALQNLVGVPKRDGNNEGQYGNRGDVYITVNNPVAEAAEESIARRMKALATAGQFR